MKKLPILKTLVDFIWILTCLPLIPVGLFFSVYIFFNDEIFKIPFKLNESNIEVSDLLLRILVLFIIALVFVLIYCFYLFRKTLRYFQQRKPFDDFVIKTYNRIGQLLIISGIVSTILGFGLPLFFKSTIRLNLGLSPYVFIICLGLFFMILSETFKVAKIAKQENELTI